MMVSGGTVGLRILDEMEAWTGMRPEEHGEYPTSSVILEEDALGFPKAMVNSK